ncbi:MAG: mechanosensitive ion channel [Bacteroidaceae bacterium]|nr:mechanosensitive ion channel [Bacteroidaceae bacterium]
MSNIETAVTNVITWCVNAGWNILGAIIIYIVGRFVIKFIMKLLHNILEKRKVEPSVESFLVSLVNITLTILLLVAVAARLGVETTSFAALLASAGVAIGMAMSGNLNNLAGGLIILLLKPFKVGDFIEAQGQSGTVKAIQIFHTIITTPDNKEVYIPNGGLSSGCVVNYSANDIRRVEWTVGVEYNEDFDKVEAVVRKLISEDARILQDPAPFVALKELADSSVNVVIRGWVKSIDYWDVNFDMNRRIYATFNREGISFPFPQLTVHQG